MNANWGHQSISTPESIRNWLFRQCRLKLFLKINLRLVSLWKCQSFWECKSLSLDNQLLLNHTKQWHLFVNVGFISKPRLNLNSIANPCGLMVKTRMPEVVGSNPTEGRNHLYSTYLLVFLMQYSLPFFPKKWKYIFS